MWNNGQGYQAYGDLNLRTWYQSDLVTITDQAMTKHYFIAGQRIASKLVESLVPEVSQNLKDKPVTPLSGDIRDLAEATATRLKRDFECLGIDYNAFYPGEVRLEALETLLNAPEQPAEYQVFFYHSDHLGSSSFITDANGDATQHLQYLPFGEDLVHEQNTAAYLSPYTFSGKERDVETNLSYFGARYYESSLSVWLSVDPMSDKYPSLSAYNYCALNPVMLVDPDGQEIEEAADPPKFWERVKRFFSGDACGNLLDAKNPNKAPKVYERTQRNPREFWKKLKPESRGDEDQGEVFVLSPKRKTRVVFDAHSIPDKLTILDENGESIVETEPMKGKKTFEIPKGVKKIKVQVEANKDNDSKFKYKVQQRHKERKTIRWEWNGIMPRRRVSTVNLN